MLLASNDFRAVNRAAPLKPGWGKSQPNLEFGINYKAWINPYGDRNLEYDTELRKDWRLLDKLEADSKAAIRQNKYPSKSDHLKLIKESKKKAEKDKKMP